MKLTGKKLKDTQERARELLGSFLSAAHPLVKAAIEGTRPPAESVEAYFKCWSDLQQLTGKQITRLTTS